MNLSFTTTYIFDGTYHIARCIELGIITQGKTLEKAKKNLKEAIELYLEDADRKELELFSTSPLIQILDCRVK